MNGAVHVFFVTLIISTLNKIEQNSPPPHENASYMYHSPKPPQMELVTLQYLFLFPICHLATSFDRSTSHGTWIKGVFPLKKKRKNIYKKKQKKSKLKKRAKEKGHI